MNRRAHAGLRQTHLDKESAQAGDKNSLKNFSKEIAAKKVIDKLFEKIMADDDLAFFFEGVDPEHLKYKQEVMMDVFFGEGVQGNDSVYLRDAHLGAIKERGLCERHFDTFVKYFQMTLEELGALIPEEKRKQAMVNIRATRMYFRPVQKGE
mmetsp:Transcript_16437/g.35535  ORF Transcript_16437/g.35535 Transcript_16437/m.35535 type:complete len:152 (-) Transcript_16437:758-1213(-)|eukprot:CAMPEP_0202901182 /NCGR_PEP_ID=MMETSP1392-20130828/13811_1 /ASSEMBLY_ACC=CAM_ASM_000868 /TAXON_ID=225041 /ORGANISM="Chlamydomonas chlamydogama, Strain SAG 11-48b" /LENGTH=151 /DNA_ID=CAMNT_0049587701 /DNA_START=167 /DNA_END=622 /DNA_ORIENTATION=+